MKIIGKSLAAVFVLLATVATQSVDYCDKELCKKYTAAGEIYHTKHIACHNNGDFTSACPRERSLVPMTKDLKNRILQQQNEYRRKVAIGKLKGYSKANQMIEMVRIIKKCLRLKIVSIIHTELAS